MTSDTIIPDKTQFRFDAYHVLPDSPQMQKDFLELLASLAARSSESWAGEVEKIAKINSTLPVAVEGFQEFLGRGLGGLLTFPNEQRPRAVVMGSREFIKECGLEIPDILEVTTRLWEKDENSFVLIAGWDACVRGVARFVRV